MRPDHPLANAFFKALRQDGNLHIAHGQLVTLLLLLSNDRLFETESAKQDSSERAKQLCSKTHEHQQSYNAGIYLD